MIDHLLGRPSTSLKRAQIFSVILFWLYFLVTGKRDGPNPSIRRLNALLSRFSPWQIVVFSSVGIYTIRHLDSLLGFGAPEPLARMYSRNFYRTTWLVTALDAGFATAMNIKPKWLRDIMSMVFSAYYVVYANEADEKLRKYRAFCTVEMMRTTWEKTTNPYIRLATWFHRPSLAIARPLLIPRPQVGAHHTRPSKAWLFYAKSERHLRMEEELVLDLCGGGYICMNPQHHEERLRQLAKQMQKPVLCVDYCKAPEYPYPFALEECFDLYRTLHETAGRVIGMSGNPNFRIILTGDSAGGNLATGVVLKIIQYPQPRIQLAYSSQTAKESKQSMIPPHLPKPIGVVLSYPSLNFGFSSWMKPEHLRLLRQQSEVNLDNLAQNQTGLAQSASSSSSLKGTRRRSAASLANAAVASAADRKRTEAKRARSKERQKDPRSYQSLTRTAELHLDERARYAEVDPTSDENGSFTPPDTSYDQPYPKGALTPSWEKSGLPWGQVTMLDEMADREEKRAQARFESEQKLLQQAAAEADSKTQQSSKRCVPFNTRLTVTSMAGYFQDRIITQGMLRAMAILYVGPKRQPDLDHDYFLSPVVAPAHLLAEFPPVLFICGEKDPLCDDTVIMAGRIREAKLAKKADLQRRRAMASARFGEGLRTTPITSCSPATTNNAVDRGLMSGGLPAVDPIEDETAEDWVQMRIIEGWSHGFLQMSSLMPEAKQVIGFLGTWMSLVFEEYGDKLDEERERKVEETRKKLVESRSRDGSPMMNPSTLFDVVGKGVERFSAAAAAAAAAVATTTTTAEGRSVGGGGGGENNRGQVQVIAAQGEKEDADDEEEEEDEEGEEDGPIMVLPRKHRPSLNASSQIQQTSPSATSTEPRKPCSASSRSSIFTDSTIHTQMAALGAVAGKHTLINSSGGGIGGIGDIRSYSDSEAAGAHATVGGPSHATLHDNIDGKAGGADSETNLDSEAGGGDGTAARSDLFGLNSTTAARRASRGGGGGGGGGGVGVGSGMGNDNKYRVGMLVEEASLLDRRRDDVLYGLEGNSAIVEGDDESDDDVSVIEENRDTRRRSRGRLVGESSTDTTISDK